MHAITLIYGEQVLDDLEFCRMHEEIIERYSHGAATSETVSRGVFMLAVYSAGLAIPFLLTALGINQFLGFYKRFRRQLHAVEVGSGVLLLAVGCLIFVNRLTLLSGKLTFLNAFVK